MDILIREATIQDASVVVHLISEMASSIDGSSPITEQYAREYLSSPSSHILLAEIQGQAVGLLSYSIRPDLYHAAPTALIEELVVSEGFRSQGVGGALLDEVLSRLEKSGCAEVSLSVLNDNLDAIRLYRAHGLADEALYLEKHFYHPPPNP
jgi:ribosomal protein S18 acetylase RimI-like enzyme